MTYILHQVLGQDCEALCIRFLGSLTRHNVLEESFEAFHVIERSESAKHEQILFCHVHLILIIDITLRSFCDCSP